MEEPAASSAALGKASTEAGSERLAWTMKALPPSSAFTDSSASSVHAVIEGEREGAHPAERLLTLMGGGFLRDATYAENGGFWLIDDGRKGINFKLPKVGDGKGAAA